MKIQLLFCLIIILITSCEKKIYNQIDYQPITYDQVKNMQSVPSYIKFPIDFATKIYITPGNTDTAHYVPLCFDCSPDSTNTTNYIQAITIEAIQWFDGSIAKDAEYILYSRRDSLRFALKYKSNSDLVDINSGHWMTNTMASFQINHANDNNEIFECYDLSYNTLSRTIYQQPASKMDLINKPGTFPVVYIYDVYGLKNLPALGKIINSVTHKATDTTIRYFHY